MHLLLLVRAILNWMDNNCLKINPRWFAELPAWNSMLSSILEKVLQIAKNLELV